MKLYDEHNPAPNPRRVRIYLAEKGIELPLVHVKLGKGEHKSDDHKARNSLGQIPTLELDDGTHISESVSICRYLEALHPEPPLFGKTPLEAARVDMWIRRIEFQLMTPVGMFWRHAHPLTARLLTQFTKFGESNREAVRRVMLWLDRELANGEGHIAGADFTMADIIAVTTIDFANWIGLETPPEASALKDWHAKVLERPGVKSQT